MKALHLRSAFFIALLIGVLLVVFKMFQPYLQMLAIASTVAVILHPAYEKLLKKLGGRETLAAIIMVVCTVALPLIPLSLLIAKIAADATALYSDLRGNSALLPTEVINTFQSWIDSVAPGYSIDLGKYAGQALTWIGQNLQSFFAGTVQTVMLLFLGIFASYYLFKDGDKFVKSLIELSPLTESEDRKILIRLRDAVNSVIRGSLIIASLQGIVTGIGLAIFGVPGAVLLGSIAGVGALIPSVGTSIVLGPVIIYLLVTKDFVSAGGLAIWGAVAVGMLDNFLHPMLVGRGMKMHPLFIFFSVIGGIGYFGLTGFILGPLVMSLLLGLLEIFRGELRKK